MKVFITIAAASFLTRIGFDLGVITLEGAPFVFGAMLLVPVIVDVAQMLLEYSPGIKQK